MRALQSRAFWPLLAGVYIVCRLGTWGYPFDSDHWIFYYVGHDWFHGGSLYVTAWDHKPPLIFLYNGLISVVLGGDIALHRGLFTALSLVDIYLFYRLASTLAPRLVGGLADPGLFTRVAVLLYVFWRDLSQFTGSADNTENLGVLFALGMLLALLSFRDRGGAWRLLGSGACLSVLFYLKPNFLLLGVPPAILLIAAYRGDIARLVGSLAVFAAPLIVQSIAWVAYFSARGTLHDFLVASFLFSSKYARSAWAGDVSSTSVRLVSIASLLLLLAPVIALGAVYLMDYRARRASEAYWLIGLSTVAALGLTLDVGAFYPYYFLIALPAFAIVMAFGLVRLPRLHFDVRNLVALGVAACMLVSLAYSMKQLVNSFTGAVHADALEYQTIAAYVDARTSTQDRVFDYDYGATFYQLAGRRSGSRFVSASVLLLDYRDRYGFDLDSTFMEEMASSRAKYVVLPRNPGNVYYENAPLVAYFNREYTVEKEFPDYDVLRRR
jgi:hypothetical protein